MWEKIANAEKFINKNNSQCPSNCILFVIILKENTHVPAYMVLLPICNVNKSHLMLNVVILFHVHLNKLDRNEYKEEPFKKLDKFIWIINA